MSADSANIARHLPLMAARQPGHPAVKVPRGRTGRGSIDYLTLSFAELDAEVEGWCARLTARGVHQGDRTLVMVRPGLPLIAAVFALFKLGAVPVVIDPGMGRKNFLSCVRHSHPRVLLGVPFAQLLSRICFPFFRAVEVRVGVSHSLTSRVVRPSTFDPRPSTMAASQSDELAAILFTSGSTGAPKGVCYEHGMFDAQVRLIRDTYGIEPGEIDLPLLPIFALFNPALGLTTVVPEIDPARPAGADPAKIVQAIRQEGVTNSFGSPTLWRKVFDHCLAHGIRLPSLRRVLCAGAPVPASLWSDAPRVLTDGKLHSPYGATEALPVSTVCADEIDPNSIRGALVGRPLAESRVKIIAVTDAPIAILAEARELPPGEVGEIIVAGPTVTQEYDQLPNETRTAKIPSGIRNPQSGIPETWHRMGDAGFLDAGGRLWFCGRLAERLQTSDGVWFTEPGELVFRGHPRVARCALIGLGPGGRQEPALVVQPTMGADEGVLARELRDLARRHAHTASLRKFFFHPGFPVDVRHNAKIHRLALARWAATARCFEPDKAG